MRGKDSQSRKGLRIVVFLKLTGTKNQTEPGKGPAITVTSSNIISIHDLLMLDKLLANVYHNGLILTPIRYLWVVRQKNRCKPA
jgi:hypothetical protein